MANNIRYYLNLNGLTQKDICSALNIAAPTFSDWVNAKTYPRIDKIELMANYFGVMKSDLVEDRAKKDASTLTPKLTPGTAKIYYTDRGDGRTKVKEVPSEAIDKALDLLRTLAPEIFDDDK